MAPLIVNANAAGDDKGPDPSKTNYILLQTKQELTHQQQIQLQALQVAIQSRLGVGKYLARYPPSDLKPLRSLDYVVGVDTYAPILKLHGDFGVHMPDIQFQAGTTAVKAKDVEAKIPIIIRLHSKPDETAEQLVKRLAGQGILDEAKADVQDDRIAAEVAIKHLGQIAAVESVSAVAPSIAGRAVNNLARTTLGLPVPAVRPHDLGGGTYDGRGQVVSVHDTGCDKGSRDDMHAHFGNRVIRLIDGRAKASKDVPLPVDVNDVDGHGTHVIGSIIGSGTWRFNDADVLVEGTAPGATVISVKILDNRGDIFKDWNGNQLKASESMNRGFYSPQNPARVFNNSWGTDGGLYNLNAGDIDRFVYDHEPHRRNEALGGAFVCWAASNHGDSTNPTWSVLQFSQEAVAKNVLTVGACESSRPFDRGVANRHYFSPGGAGQQSPDRVASFSSRGPTLSRFEAGNPANYVLTRRIKPDVLAPGELILSTRSRAIDASKEPQSADKSGFEGNTGSRDWAFLSGTSMATPLVSGCAAVLRQMLLERHGIDNPPACALRALLVNGAELLVGMNRDTTWPQQGFGRVNMAATSAHISSPELTLRYGVARESTGMETIPVQIGPAAGGAVRTLKATLAWTDPAADTDALQCRMELYLQRASNDGMDLPGETAAVRTYGNHWQRVQATWGGPADLVSHAPDAENNVQQVMLPGITPGRYNLHVNCTLLTGEAEVAYAIAWMIS